MQLVEISPQEQMSLNLTKWKSVQQLRRFLLSKDYKELGKGLFSQVWAKDGDNTVIKISTREDVCWLRYARWVMKQSTNPHLPKIYSLRTYTTKEGKLFVSRLERLEEAQVILTDLPTKIAKESDPRKVSEIVWLASLHYSGLLQTHVFPIEITKLLEKSPLRKNPEFKDLTPAEILKKCMRKFSGTKLSRTISTAQKEILKDKNCYKDLHDGNMMRRSDGTLVLMDPAAMYCGSGAVSGS